MGISVGTDIVMVARMQSITKAHFFTEAELLSPVQTDEHFAGLFAAKEAFVKAIKTGFGRIRPLDISVLKTESGAPYLVLSDKLQADYAHLSFDVSISHSGGFATAVVIAFPNAQVG